MEMFTLLNLKPNLRLIAIIGLLSVAAIGQGIDHPEKVNPYSPSPESKALSANEYSAITIPTIVSLAEIDDRQPVIAQRTFKVTETPNDKRLSPTEIYRVGIGDILFIDLKNSDRGSGYYTVRDDGTIDFPLAGENVVVAAQTVDVIAEILASNVKLYPDPKFIVKVREYASHQITVSGMVDRSGSRVLHRESVPLYVIRAEAGVDPKATKVIIRRPSSQIDEKYDLREAATENLLISSNYSIQFISEVTNVPNAFIYIAGAVQSQGQQPFSAGLTLYQALISAGGVKGDAKKAVIRRKGRNGALISFEHNVRSIKDGKAPDPAMAVGDIVEVIN